MTIDMRQGRFASDRDMRQGRFFKFDTGFRDLPIQSPDTDIRNMDMSRQLLDPPSHPPGESDAGGRG